MIWPGFASRAGAPRSIAICGVDETPVAEAADDRVILGFADERSVVQTRFATSALAFLRASLGEDLASVADEGERALAADLPFEPGAFEHFVFLGRGWTVGLANEAALKMRETSGAWAESYPAMEYRHGPISVAGPRSVVWPLGDVESDLLQDVAATGATVVDIGLGSLDPMAELILVQRTAVALAWNPRRRVLKVRMPDTELGQPKTIMKVRMDRRFQVRGRPGCPGSTLPGQQPGSAGAGDMRLAGRLLRQQGRDPWGTP